MMHALDEANIEHSIHNASANQHIKLWALEGCWKKASLPGPKQKTRDRIFQARLFSKSLPTPRNVQVTNEAKFPKLYPGCKCPVCDADDVDDDFHIFCKCPSIAGIRRLATHNVKKQIDKTHFIQPCKKTICMMTLHRPAMQDSMLHYAQDRAPRRGCNGMGERSKGWWQQQRQRQ